MILAVLLFFGLSPRLVVLFIAILTDWFSRAYDTKAWPILGFFFMPYTTLAYMAGILNSHTGSLSGPWVFLVVFAVLLDFANNASVSASRSNSSA
jgi:uncharacterized metal-binding protein